MNRCIGYLIKCFTNCFTSYKEIPSHESESSESGDSYLDYPMYASNYPLHNNTPCTEYSPSSFPPHDDYDQKLLDLRSHEISNSSSEDEY